MSKEQADSLPGLKVSKQRAIKLIKSQIDKGREIDSYQSELNYLRDISIWFEDTTPQMERVFDDETIRQIRSNIDPNEKFVNAVLNGDLMAAKSIFINTIMELELILEKLESMPEVNQTSKVTIMDTTSKPKIFVVHGRDPVRHELDALLLRWGLDPEMLEDQPNLGQTLIEKFEKNSDAQCVIVLLTPDDEGRLKGTKELKSRSRQNVVFELGYFFGKSGRGKVICLHKGDIELPSDISGIVYIPFSDNLKDEVYRRLRKELKAMGFTIND
jgi:predicted nucleotide-binding protein